MGELVTNGKVRRAYLGIAGQVRPLDRRVQRHFALQTATAIEIVWVQEGGPARQAGLREGDLVLALNGQSIVSVDEIHRRLVGWPVGSLLSLTILRNGEQREVQIVPGEG